MDLSNILIVTIFSIITVFLNTFIYKLIEFVIRMLIIHVSTQNEQIVTNIDKYIIENNDLANTCIDITCSKPIDTWHIYWFNGPLLLIKRIESRGHRPDYFKYSIYGFRNTVEKFINKVKTI